MNVKPLLALIRHHEARDDYNVVWGKIKSGHRPQKPLTSMRIREVLNWQDSIDHLYMSEAAGGYQILEDTLREIYAPAGLSIDDYFSVENQDKLAIYLLNRRGLKDYMRGHITQEQLANNIAMEWASFPVVTGIKKGRSYYAGDGLNKALVSVDEVMDAIGKIKDVEHVVVGPELKKENWLVALIKRIFGM